MRPVRDIFRDATVLDASGRHVNGSDRESNHRYGDAYERLLGTMRTRASLVMEVGVADGSGLLAWREVFPYATVVGLDIHPSDKARGERIEFHLGDATKREDCERAAAGRRFDVIIEDATHLLADTLTTLLYLWPFVRHGGLYVIEEFSDICSLRNHVTSLWPNSRIVDTVGPSGGLEPLVVLQKEEYL